MAQMDQNHLTCASHIWVIRIFWVSIQHDVVYELSMPNCGWNRNVGSYRSSRCSTKFDCWVGYQNSEFVWNSRLVVSGTTKGTSPSKKSSVGYSEASSVVVYSALSEGASPSANSSVRYNEASSAVRCSERAKCQSLSMNTSAGYIRQGLLSHTMFETSQA
jgi:hypothetical protein